MDDQAVIMTVVMASHTVAVVSCTDCHAVEIAVLTVSSAVDTVS